MTPNKPNKTIKLPKGVTKDEAPFYREFIQRAIDNGYTQADYSNQAVLYATQYVTYHKANEDVKQIGIVEQQISPSGAVKRVPNPSVGIADKAYKNILALQKESGFTFKSSAEMKRSDKDETNEDLIRYILGSDD